MPGGKLTGMYGGLVWWPTWPMSGASRSGCGPCTSCGWAPPFPDGC